MNTVEIAERYRDDIIHVRCENTSLNASKPAFFETNKAPLAEMINAGQMTFDGTVYVMRRVIPGNMANDVGYLHSVITMPGREAIEQVQKFSRVFIKESGEWQLITDFDVTSAPLAVLEDIEPEITIN